jgi:hypothetical protein
LQLPLLLLLLLLFSCHPSPKAEDLLLSLQLLLSLPLLFPFTRRALATQSGAPA